MPWKTRFLPAEKIIEIKFKGKFLANDIGEILRSVLMLVQQEKTLLVLGDCTLMEHNTSVFNIYDFPKLFESQNVNRHIKEAMVLPIDPEARKNVEFYETVCHNRGFNVKVFETRAQALDWLLG